MKHGSKGDYRLFFLVTDWNPSPGKSRTLFSDYYPGAGNFQEQTLINRDHFFKSVICSRLWVSVLASIVDMSRNNFITFF